MLRFKVYLKLLERKRRLTPVGRGHWCNGQNGEEEENALHPGFENTLKQRIDFKKNLRGGRWTGRHWLGQTIRGKERN